ncbi:hypothetical protein LPAF129_07550 [Ligilactobacillus pabuli]|uniref:NERD domain-containing protein n=1 Tax=Ligilactobacillus pabuli TaxID=2886039 RepID=A0ABQ5JJ19_9LACO|nr:nuclease-related domain-containing protein [Ligilactobacillus pabuli]GKS81070.1 hypothetical protein LPAF129_07550 [Ligilactobacillus pabuli]
MRKEALETQYLQVLQERVQLTTTEQAKFQRAQAGYQGECTFDRWSAELLTDCLDDVNLSYQGSRCQMDKLFVHGSDLYVIDVKNYNGAYSYQAGCWYYNGRVLAHNIFEQLTRAQDLLARCLSDQHVKLQVKSVLVFMDPRVQLDLTDPPAHIEIKSAADAYAWLVSLNQEKFAMVTPPWKQAVRHYEVPGYRPRQDLGDTPRRHYRHGIRCVHCGQFAMSQGRYAVTCQHCGTSEAKEHAYVRTICDYGVLFFKRDLRRRDLCEFFGEGYSERYLTFVLSKHFVSKGKRRARNFAYINKGIRFQYWFADKSDYFRKIQQRINWERQ